ncbi:recombinase RecT [Thermus antranikianii]|uniref:recombinase RecT n=1 Tax=Thermus antranikianii TaxID=88190 RepID=UPI001C7559CB|nr:recombinase RecT [Thermus antranikianii]QWK23098.1 MAG: recombinase RecT [Thermus antranikianii]
MTERNTAALARKRLFAGVPDEDVHLALAICQRYGLDPLLRHVVLIPGGKDRRHNVYITRDGLLHVAHTSGRAWSLEVEEPKRMENPYTGKPDIYLRGRVRVYDPDTGREQVFEGGVWFSEYAQKGGSWNSHPAAMHQKVLEVFLLRRAFDVAVTPVEEMGVDHVESASMPVSPACPSPARRPGSWSSWAWPTTERPPVGWPLWWWVGRCRGTPIWALTRPKRFWPGCAPWSRRWRRQTFP